MSRFLLPPAAWPEHGHQADLTGDEARHLAQVLRIQTGASVTVFDGQGRRASARVLTVNRSRVTLELGESRLVDPVRPVITLAQAIPKGKTMDLNPTEGKRWLSVGPTRASQIIVEAVIVNNKIGKTYPYLFITDDAITDRFSGQTFIGKTNNDAGSKGKISIWTRIDWAGGLSDNGGLRGTITNYKKNVLEQGECKPAMVKQHKDMVLQRFGQKGKLDMLWQPGIYQGDNSLLSIKTETSAVFTRPAPTALLLTQKLWKPITKGKINFTLAGSNAGLSKIFIYTIRSSSAAKTCSLKP